ncbi:MAG: LysM peptidoglycan-binding domain-containing protein [Phycicoccus sp.]|nr:LysM peptidoglycan-binding domain-containing protein [Phycicoccus sp.]
MQSPSNNIKQPHTPSKSGVEGSLGPRRVRLSSAGIGLSSAGIGLSGAGIVAVGALVLWWARVLRPALTDLATPAPTRPADALLLCVAGAAFLLGCWLVLGLLLSLLSHVPGLLGRVGGTLSEAITPRLLRQLVAALLGMGATTVLLPPVSLAAPATAPVVACASTHNPGPAWTADLEPSVPAPSPSPASALDTATPAATAGLSASRADLNPPIDPGWVAPAPTVRPAPDHRALTGPGWKPTGDGEIVVHRGDTLWDLAARHLGHDATSEEIARAWPQWYAANRDLIGNNPDLLLPGQVLRIPDSVGAPR